jgi:hypothetical protein
MIAPNIPAPGGSPIKPLMSCHFGVFCLSWNLDFLCHGIYDMDNFSGIILREYKSNPGIFLRAPGDQRLSKSQDNSDDVSHFLNIALQPL